MRWKCAGKPYRDDMELRHIVYVYVQNGGRPGTHSLNQDKGRGTMCFGDKDTRHLDVTRLMQAGELGVQDGDQNDNSRFRVPGRLWQTVANIRLAVASPHADGTAPQLCCPTCLWILGVGFFPTLLPYRPTYKVC